MSWGRRPLVVVGLGVCARLLAALPLGLVMEAWVRAPTRHQPEGELALFARGGLLLFERYFVAGTPAAATPMALFSVALAALIGLLPYGLLLHVLHEPRASLRAALVATLGCLGRLFFLSALQAVAVALLVFGAVFTLRGQPVVTVLAWSISTLLVATFADAARVRALLGGESLDHAIPGALRALRARPWRMLGRAVAARLIELGAALAVVLILGTVALRGPAAFATGALAGLAGLLAMALARAWFLNALITIVMLEPLRTTPRLGYESGPSGEEPR